MSRPAGALSAFQRQYPYEYISAIQKEIEAKEYLKTFINRPVRCPMATYEISEINRRIEQTRKGLWRSDLRLQESISGVGKMLGA